MNAGPLSVIAYIEPVTVLRMMFWSIDRKNYVAKFSVLHLNISANTALIFLCYTCWTLRKEDIKRLEAFKMWIWRQRESVGWKNEEITRTGGIIGIIGWAT